MARLRGRIQIERSREQVFDTVADSRNEPLFNPDMRAVELLTPPPVGKGSRFRAHMGGSDVQMLVELVEFDRPHRLFTRTSSPLMTTSGTLTFETVDQDAGQTAMTWDWDVRPRGWLRMLGPMFGLIGGRVERKIWTGMKRHLESAPPESPGSAGGRESSGQQ